VPGQGEIVVLVSRDSRPARLTVTPLARPNGWNIAHGVDDCLSRDKSDEQAGAAGRQGRDIMEVGVPGGAKIIFEVRDIKDRDCGAMFFDVTGHAEWLLGPAKSPTTGMIRFLASRSFKY
jgi:hypothetical protein